MVSVFLPKLTGSGGSAGSGGGGGEGGGGDGAKEDIPRRYIREVYLVSSFRGTLMHCKVEVGESEPIPVAFSFCL